MRSVNTALLSVGMSGLVFHAPFLQTDRRFRLHAVWERSKNVAQQTYPHVVVYRSLQEVLADEAVELVVVNTPNYTHYEYTKQCLNAGKHVVVEKPFTVAVEEGEELIALASSKGLLLSVYHNRRFDSDYRTLKKVLDKGLLGDVVEAEFHYDRYKQELSPKVHKETPGPGTGALYDLGSHLVDQSLQMFGMPEAVFADIRTVRPVSQVDDYFEVLLYYPTLRVRLHSSYLVREALPAYALHGSAGSFIKSKSDVQEEMLQAGAVPGGEDWGIEPDEAAGLLHTQVQEGMFYFNEMMMGSGVQRLYIPSERGNYGDYYDGIYKALREGGPAPVSAEDGLAVIKVIRAAMRSSEERKVVRL